MAAGVLEAVAGGLRACLVLCLAAAPALAAAKPELSLPLEHAHPSGVGLVVDLWCRRDRGKNLLLDLTDDGVGLPVGFDPWREIASLRVPGLLLHAGRGNFPLPFIEKFCAESDTLECRSLDAGHLLPMVAPDLLADALLAWLGPGSPGSA